MVSVQHTTAPACQPEGPASLARDVGFNLGWDENKMKTYKRDLKEKLKNKAFKKEYSKQRVGFEEEKRLIKTGMKNFVAESDNTPTTQLRQPDEQV